LTFQFQISPDNYRSFSLVGQVTVPLAVNTISDRIQNKIASAPALTQFRNSDYSAQKRNKKKEKKEGDNRIF